MEEVEYGKSDSSKTTCRKIRTRREVRSKHRYPLWSGEYPKNTQRDERGASLWEAVAEVLG